MRVEKMLLAYYLAASPLFSGMLGSRMCLPCMFSWLVFWGSRKLGSRCELIQAIGGCSVGPKLICEKRNELGICDGGAVIIVVVGWCCVWEGPVWGMLLYVVLAGFVGERQAG